MDLSTGHYAPLLEDDLDAIYEEQPQASRRAKQRPRRNPALPFIYKLVLTFSIFFNVFLLSLGTYLYQHSGPENVIFPQSLYSPAQEVISYRTQTFNGSFVQDGFLGPPTPDIDSRWKALYRVGNSRITKDEAARLPNKTIAAIAGVDDDYLVVISVFHDLHCLDRIRQSLWYFYDTDWNSTHNPFTVERPPTFERGGLNGVVHLDHCLNILRQSIQCFSDITPYVFQWSPKANEVHAYANVVHTCRNFETVRDWALDRTYAGSWNGRDPRDEEGACRSGDSGHCLSLA